MLRTSFPRQSMGAFHFPNIKVAITQNTIRQLNSETEICVHKLKPTLANLNQFFNCLGEGVKKSKNIPNLTISSLWSKSVYINYIYIYVFHSFSFKDNLRDCSFFVEIRGWMTRCDSCEPRHCIKICACKARIKTRPVLKVKS